MDKLRDSLPVQEALRVRGIEWHFNVPTAHHMGGPWERLIKTTRKVLFFLMKGQFLDDERLKTVISGAESILNSRPLTGVSDDPSDLTPLTPNDLLLVKSREYAPGVFTEADRFRKKWRHCEYLKEQFWLRWTKEYLSLLNLRQRWFKPKRNLKVGDICLMMQEQQHRNHWPMCRVTNVFPGKDGLVRKVEIKTQSGTYLRPVHHLVLLELDE